MPEQYTRGLSALFEHNRCSDIADVRRVVQEELGAPPEQLFASFDPEPIASASLAQVHRATRRGTGEPLAVKVQHAGMLDACAADLRAVSLAVGLAEWLFPDEFRLGWVLAELAPLEVRGRVVLLHQLGVVIGIFAAGAAAYGWWLYARSSSKRRSLSRSRHS